MGLPLQHALQQTVLCRVYDLELASCFLSAVREHLGATLQESLLSFSRQKNEDKTAALIARWQTLCNERGVAVQQGVPMNSLIDLSANEEAVATYLSADTLANAESFLRACISAANTWALNKVLVADSRFAADRHAAE